MPKRKNPRQTDVNNASYRQVSNYLSNELGIDRSFVAEVIENKIEARNIESIVERQVRRFFGYDPGAAGIKNRAEERLNRCVDYEFERIMKTKTGEKLEKAAETLTAKILENALKETKQTDAEEQETLFSVMGYDKDNDAYETYMEHLTLENAKFLALAFTDMCEKDQIVRWTTKDGHLFAESIDWIVIKNEDTDEFIPDFVWKNMQED